MKWVYLDPDMVNKSVFGLHKVFAVKVAKFHNKFDVRCYRLKGWKTFAEDLEWDPRTGKELKEGAWFIYAAKGE